MKYNCEPLYSNARVVLTRMTMIVALSAVVSLVYFIFAGIFHWNAVWVTLAYSFFFWEGNAGFSYLADKFFPSIEETPKKIIVSVVFAFFYTILIVCLVSWMFYGFQRSWQSFLGEFLAGFFITLLVSAIYASISFFKMYKSSLIQAESLKRSHMESELRALNAQVNPHFLFNSLNALISLIPEDPPLAVEFTRRFSDVYRYVLQNKYKELATVRDEIEFVRNYIFLLKIRHGNQVDLELEVDETSLLKKIPTLALQMLVENATKHNVISEKKKLIITVKVIPEGYLTVANNLNPKKTPEPGAGIGLENIQKRYEYLGAKKADIHTTGDEFIVRLPLLETEDYEMHHH